MVHRPTYRLNPWERCTGQLCDTRGFTLVELLVVLGIVLLLMAMLAPALGHLRQRVETISCASQLRQLHVATTSYVVEHDGHYPDTWRWVWSDMPGGGLWVEWSQLNTVSRGSLLSYMGGDERAFLCPTFKKTTKLNPLYSHLTPHVGYSMNEYLYTSAGPSTWIGLPKIRRPQVALPARLALFADESTLPIYRDGTQLNPALINNLCLGVGLYTDTNSHVDSIAGFHNAPGYDATQGKGNVVFADGHVELLDPSQSKEVFTPELYK